MIARSVSYKTVAVMQPGGTDKHRVRLVLEPGNWESYDPFLMMAEDWFTPGTFGDHPHRGIETVTYVIEGAIGHSDNHGGEGVLSPGDAQWMTAGRGLIHAEEPVEFAHSLQLWINLPRTHKMAEPRYQDLLASEMPVRQEKGAELRVFSGQSGDVRSTTRNTHPITMVELRLEPGANVSQTIPSHDRAFIYILEGEGTFGDGTLKAKAADVLWFDPVGEEGESSISIIALTTLRAILWSGKPLHEPVAAYGPFVMNTMEEIREAFDDYRAGKL